MTTRKTRPLTRFKGVDAGARALRKWSQRAAVVRRAIVYFLPLWIGSALQALHTSIGRHGGAQFAGGFDLCQ